MKVVVWGCGQVAMRLLDTELKNVNGSMSRFSTS